MPTIIRNLRGIDPEIKTKDFDKTNDFTDDDRKFLDALKEFYTKGKSELLDAYHDGEEG